MIKPELTTTVELILNQNYKGDEPIKTLIPLKGGEWSAAYKFDFNGQSFIIRLSHTDENFCRDKVAAAWSSPDLPIPQILKLEQYKEQYYAISSFFPGEAFEEISIADLEKTIPSFLSMMRALQTTQLGSVKGFGSLTSDGNGRFNSWAEALLAVGDDSPGSLVYGWKKALSEFPDAQYKFEQFYEQLGKLVVFCPEEKGVVHSDLIHQNLLVHNHKISALIDWGCAKIGDPVHDLALIAYFEPWFPAFTAVNLVRRMQEAYLELSPKNHKNFDKRMMAYQIHWALDNMAYCAYRGRRKEIYEHINRMEEILRGGAL